MRRRGGALTAPDGTTAGARLMWPTDKVAIVTGGSLRLGAVIGKRDAAEGALTEVQNHAHPDNGPAAGNAIAAAGGQPTYLLR